MMRSISLRLCLVLAVLLQALPSIATAAGQAVTVIIVRHAEKADPDADDPEISGEGQKRAALLAKMAAESGVSAVYATQFIRTRQTVEPLAKQLGVQIEQVDSEDVKGLVARILADHAGGAVLVAGHSNTVPQIVEALTGQTNDPIDENDFSNLYVVVSWGPGQGKVVRLRYGAAPAATPAAP